MTTNRHIDPATGATVYTPPVTAPHVGDHVTYFGDRVMILAVTVTAAIVNDDAGARIHIPFDRLGWSEPERAWILVAPESELELRAAHGDK